MNKVKMPVLLDSLVESDLKTWAGMPLAGSMFCLERLQMVSAEASQMFDGIVGLDVSRRSTAMVEACMAAVRSDSSAARHIRRVGEALKSDKLVRAQVMSQGVNPEMRPVTRYAPVVVRLAADVDAMTGDVNGMAA